MIMSAYLEDKPIIAGSLGIIYFSRENVPVVLLPRTCTGGVWSKEELFRLGNGSSCRAYK